MPTLQETQLSKAEKPSFLCGHPCVLLFATSPLDFKNLQIHVVLFLSMQDRCTASPSLLLDTAFSSCFSSPRFSDCPLCGHDQSSTSCHRNSNAPLMDLQHHRLTQRCRTAHNPLSSFLVSELETKKKKKKKQSFLTKGFLSAGINVMFLGPVKTICCIIRRQHLQSRTHLHNLGSVHVPESIGCYESHTLVRTFK